MGYAVSVPDGYVYDGIGGLHLDEEVANWLTRHAPGTQPIPSELGFDISFADATLAESFLFSFI